jgi:hypothetical protein
MEGGNGAKALEAEMTDSGENHTGLNAETEQLVAQADGMRQAGFFAEARAILTDVLAAHPDHALGRLVLALLHLDLGEQDESRLVMEAALSNLSSVPEGQADPLAPIQDEMISQAEESLPPAEAATPFATDSPFVNPTMANLLEQQGHAKEAEALRSAIDEREPAPFVAEEQPEEDVLAGEMGTGSDKLAVIATLERWLDNVHRGAA